MLGGVRETRVVDRKSTRGGLGWASRRSSQPQPRWFTNAVLQIRYDVGCLSRDKYRKQDNAFPAGAGAWSMAVVTAAAEKERESAQVVYMYVHVWEQTGPRRANIAGFHGEALGFMILVP